MHGLGNDFVVLDMLSQRLRLNPRLMRSIADRNRGIGCDQILVVDAPQTPDCDFRYRIFNADGNEVEQCGNGARCFAKYVRDRRLTGKRRFRVETLGGPITIEVIRGNVFSVDMGVPILEPADIPFEAQSRASIYTLDAGSEELELSAVSMGNPHAVIEVPDVEVASVEHIGRLVENHPRFPQRANVGFMQVESRTEIRLRVWERGVGETQACGTGACAAVVAGRTRGLLDERVRVYLPGGYLTITWPGEGNALHMAGPATTVFEGQMTI